MGQRQPRIKASKVQVAESARVADDVDIQAEEVYIGPGVSLGARFRFEGQRLLLEAGAGVGRDVNVKAEMFHLGHRAVVEHECSISALRGRPAKTFTLGDCSFLGYSSTVVAPVVEVGDYTILHNHMLIMGDEPLTMGHNCWVGQQTILNSAARLTIGHNVRIGTQSQIWTHVASGELLEGSTLFGMHPITLEDDVWIVGGAVVSPGVVMKRRSVLMVGAVLSKNVEEGHCYGGVPAVDITDKIRPWRSITLDEKWAMLQGFIREFEESEPRYRGRIRCFETLPSGQEPDPGGEATIVVIKHGEAQNLGGTVSVFSLETKHYTKKRTELEQAFIRFNVGYRARFLPI
ncbi:MAG: hypothetical protein HY683_05190 [Chloroflexi bacterium]|nr:hypothetical protein [Chloroflexota bacterium]